MVWRVTVAAVLLAGAVAARGEVVEVGTSEELETAAAKAHAGVVIRLRQGEYRTGVHLRGLHGSEKEPIVIEGAEPGPPMFSGGVGGIQLSSCTYVVVRNIAFEKQTGNAINIDDGGETDRPDACHHITLDRLIIRDVGPAGIVNGIKLAGVNQLTIIRCEITGWGGSAIDLVGCHEGVIEHCTLTGKAGFSQNTGVQIKGGSRDVTVRQCTFENAGQRAVNAGGSTGLPYFRPPDAPYEAHNLTIERNLFLASETPIAFPGVDGATFRYNTVIRPTKWLWRILQESKDARFVSSRNVTLAHNLFVWEGGAENTTINIGPGTAPETYTVSDNLFFRADSPKRSTVVLPGKARDNTFGVDPKLTSEHLPGDPKIARRFGRSAEEGSAK